jgi:hypothetical protein
MLFKLLLITVLNGSVYVDVFDHNLTRDDCVTSMIEMNKVVQEGEQFVCYGESESLGSTTNPLED